MLRSTPSPMRQATATLCARLLGTLLLTILMAACDSSTGKDRGADRAPVQGASVKYQSSTQARSLAATIRPRIGSDLGFRVNGKIARRLVQNGDLVRKGQPLLVLDTVDFQLQLEQGEAEVRAATTSLAQAEADEARTTTLEQKAWSPQAMLDKAHTAGAEARGRLTRAQCAVELAHNAPIYAMLEADADGIITFTPVEPGHALPETFVERARVDWAEAAQHLANGTGPVPRQREKTRELVPEHV